MTQALIEQELGTALLMRTGFFNQNAVASLLDASDKDFKLELGKVLSTFPMAFFLKVMSSSESQFLWEVGMDLHRFV
jgi:hypothetical protein